MNLPKISEQIRIQTGVEVNPMYFKNRVLVADDEEFCLCSIQSLLLKTGFDVANRVDFCINGKAALDLVKESYKTNKSYKLIFTDFSMPIMDGIESVTRMRRYLDQELKITKSEQPIVIGLTGHIGEEF